MTGAKPLACGHDFLLYDGDCPVCARYALWSNLSASRPGITLRNAREEPRLVAELMARGVDVNDTMYLQLDGEGYAGAAAMAAMARFMPRETLRQRLIAAATGREGAMKSLYPLLVRARKLLLALLGRGQIK